MKRSLLKAFVGFALVYSIFLAFSVADSFAFGLLPPGLTLGSAYAHVVPSLVLSIIALVLNKRQRLEQLGLPMPLFKLGLFIGNVGLIIVMVAAYAYLLVHGSPVP